MRSDAPAPQLEPHGYEDPGGNPFRGFKERDIPIITHMATLLRRNQALNTCEGLMALTLLFTAHGHDNSFDVSERVLYIVCCLSNAVCLKVAHRHFSEVEAYKPDGLVTTAAGIQDLNILFSNVAFVAILRAFVQVMEAGIKDPELVVWLQVAGGILVLVRFVLLQQLLLLKRQGSRPLPGNAHRSVHTTLPRTSAPFLLHAAMEAAKPAWWRDTPANSMGSMFSPLKMQRMAQVYPKMLVTARGDLRGPGRITSLLRRASALAARPVDGTRHDAHELRPCTQAAGSYANATELADMSAARRHSHGRHLSDKSMHAHAAGTAQQQVGGTDAVSATQSSSQDLRAAATQTGTSSRALNDVAVTSINKSTLPAADFSTSVLQSIGVSVDDTATGSSRDSAPDVPTPNHEHSISGDLEGVLKNNMEQLQWTSLSMSLLTASTALLAVAQDIPAMLVSSHEHYAVARDALPSLTAVGVDMSEQVAMAAALATARGSFRNVLEKRGHDITNLLDGLSEHRGLAHFLETWGIVQCGVIAALFSRILLAQNWVEVPAKEIVKVAGELIR